MTTTETYELAELKQRSRATWSAGNFPEVARRQLWEVGDRLVRRVGIGTGERVLDVACGTGNAAIRAAAAGGSVVGVDLTPKLLEAGEREARAAGVQIDWVEGDAEDLPVDDETFDVVLSTFGVMFAPRHEVTAHEVARVLRPGGRIGLCNWTPEGLQGKFFRALGGLMPPPPPFAKPPLLWGNEEHVQGLFAGTGVQLEFERAVITDEPFASGEEAFEFGAANFGQLIMLRRAVGDRKWAELRTILVDLYETGGPAEYLITLGRKL